MSLSLATDGIHKGEFTTAGQRSSVGYAIECFRKAVTKMEKTVLVPRRLMDLPLLDELADCRVYMEDQQAYSATLMILSGMLQFTDLYRIYIALCSLGQELQGNSTIVTATQSYPAPETIVRQSSVCSLASLMDASSSTSDICSPYGSMKSSRANSITISDSSSSNNGFDRDGSDDTSATMEEELLLAVQLRQYSIGLRQCLERMTLIAEYLTIRYQIEVGCID